MTGLRLSLNEFENLQYFSKLFKQAALYNSDINSFAAHPGIADTELSRNYPKWLYFIVKYTIAPFLTQSARNGAKPSLLASLGVAQGGEYFGPTGYKEYKGKAGKASSSDLSKNPEVAKRLWEVSEQLVNFKYFQFDV